MSSWLLHFPFSFKILKQKKKEEKLKKNGHLVEKKKNECQRWKVSIFHNFVRAFYSEMQK